jgi:putative transposase
MRACCDASGCDNVFVERLWRSLKHEHIHLHADEPVTEARSKIGRYCELDSSKRPHSSPGAQTPDPVSLPRPPEALVAY